MFQNPYSQILPDSVFSAFSKTSFYEGKSSDVVNIVWALPLICLNWRHGTKTERSVLCVNIETKKPALCFEQKRPLDFFSFENRSYINLGYD